MLKNARKSATGRVHLSQKLLAREQEEALDDVGEGHSGVNENGKRRRVSIDEAGGAEKAKRARVGGTPHRTEGVSHVSGGNQKKVSSGNAANDGQATAVMQNNQAEVQIEGTSSRPNVRDKRYVLSQPASFR
jgi:hypothetical protein